MLELFRITSVTHLGSCRFSSWFWLPLWCLLCRISLTGFRFVIKPYVLVTSVCLRITCWLFIAWTGPRSHFCLQTPTSLRMLSDGGRLGKIIQIVWYLRFLLRAIWKPVWQQTVFVLFGSSYRRNNKTSVPIKQLCTSCLSYSHPSLMLENPVLTAAGLVPL